MLTEITVNSVIFASCYFRPFTLINGFAPSWIPRTQLCWKRDDFRHWNSPSLKLNRWQRWWNGRKIKRGRIFPFIQNGLFAVSWKKWQYFFLFQRYRNCFLNLDILSTQNLSVCGENILENCKVVNGSTTFECTLDFTEGNSTL